MLTQQPGDTWIHTDLGTPSRIYFLTLYVAPAQFRHTSGGRKLVIGMFHAGTPQRSYMLMSDSAFARSHKRMKQLVQVEEDQMRDQIDLSQLSRSKKDFRKRGILPDIVTTHFNGKKVCDFSCIRGSVCISLEESKALAAVLALAYARFLKGVGKDQPKHTTSLYLTGHNDNKIWLSAGSEDSYHHQRIQKRHETRLVFSL